MPIFISHQSGIELLRTNYVYQIIANTSKGTFRHPPLIPNQPPHLSEKREFWRTLHEILGNKPQLPIHVSITSNNGATKQKDCKYIFSMKKFPKLHFLRYCPISI